MDRGALSPALLPLPHLPRPPLRPPHGPPSLHALVRVLEEARTLEVEEGLPGGAVLYRLPLPGPAPEGSEAWREVELEALLAEGEAS